MPVTSIHIDFILSSLIDFDVSLSLIGLKEIIQLVSHDESRDTQTWTIHTDKQEFIPVGCVLSVCPPYIANHQMSVLGILK